MPIAEKSPARYRCNILSVLRAFCLLLTSHPLPLISDPLLCSPPLLKSSRVNESGFEPRILRRFLCGDGQRPSRCQIRVRTGRRTTLAFGEQQSSRDRSKLFLREQIRGEPSAPLASTPAGARAPSPCRHRCDHNNSSTASLRGYRSKCVEVLRRINEALARWAQRFTQFRRRERASMHWLGCIARRDPNLFVLWQPGGLILRWEATIKSPALSRMPI